MKDLGLCLLPYLPYFKRHFLCLRIFGILRCKHTVQNKPRAEFHHRFSIGQVLHKLRMESQESSMGHSLTRHQFLLFSSIRLFSYVLKLIFRLEKGLKHLF